MFLDMLAAFISLFSGGGGGLGKVVVSEARGWRRLHIFFTTWASSVYLDILSPVVVLNPPLQVEAQRNATGLLFLKKGCSF